MSLRFFEIDPKYIDFLAASSKHLFRNKKDNQNFSRKYIGILLNINGVEYFAPLSSFKEKHKRLSETVDFIKLEEYAVLNINNMIPVPKDLYKPINFNNEKNTRYRNLLRNEYRVLKQKSELILQSARKVYEHKIKHGENSKLGKRCNDFLKLEKLCGEYKE